MFITGWSQERHRRTVTAQNSINSILTFNVLGYEQIQEFAFGFLRGTCVEPILPLGRFYFDVMIMSHI